MKLLLINPPYDIERYMGNLGNVGWVIPPAGLLSIASYLEKNGVKVKIYDAQVEERPLISEIRKFKPDIIGITCVTSLFYSMKETAKKIKENFDIPVVVGGVHPTVLPEETLKDRNIDFVIRGEGHITTLELLKALRTKRFSRIKGISYRRNGKIVHNQDRPLIKNLDDIPYPAYHLIDFEKYRTSPDLDFGSRSITVYSSIGCPYNCTFCANPVLTKRCYRQRSVNNLMGEIDMLIKKYRINFLMIGDNDFTVNRKWTMDFCREYIKRGYNSIPWETSVRADQLDEELLSMMKKAGCKLLSLGLESGVQRILDIMNKRVTVAQLERGVKLVKDSGIIVRGSFILGMPTETREESLETIRFSRKLPLDQVRFAIATPFPGTELFEMAKNEGMKVDDWTKFSLMVGYTDYDPVYVPKGRTAKELKELQRKANLGFFLRPRQVLVMIKRIRSLRDMKKIFKGFFYLMKASFFLKG